MKTNSGSTSFVPLILKFLSQPLTTWLLLTAHTPPRPPVATPSAEMSSQAFPPCTRCRSTRKLHLHIPPNDKQQAYNFSYSNLGKHSLEWASTLLAFLAVIVVVPLFVCYWSECPLIVISNSTSHMNARAQRVRPSVLVPNLLSLWPMNVKPRT